MASDLIFPCQLSEWLETCVKPFFKSTKSGGSKYNFLTCWWPPASNLQITPCVQKRVWHQYLIVLAIESPNILSVTSRWPPASHLQITIVSYSNLLGTLGILALSGGVEVHHFISDLREGNGSYCVSLVVVGGCWVQTCWVILLHIYKNDKNEDTEEEDTKVVFKYSVWNPNHNKGSLYIFCPKSKL